MASLIFPWCTTLALRLQTILNHLQIPKLTKKNRAFPAGCSNLDTLYPFLKTNLNANQTPKPHQNPDQPDA
jgi:hypothetical protein